MPIANHVITSRQTLQASTKDRRTSPRGDEIKARYHLVRDQGGRSLAGLAVRHIGPRRFQQPLPPHRQAQLLLRLRILRHHGQIRSRAATTNRKHEGTRLTTALRNLGEEKRAEEAGEEEEGAGEENHGEAQPRPHQAPAGATDNAAPGTLHASATLLRFSAESSDAGCVLAEDDDEFGRGGAAAGGSGLPLLSTPSVEEECHKSTSKFN
jgi:hypothetical protein